MRPRNVKAWLITWEGDHRLENPVAMLLHRRTPLRRVGEVIELLYVNAYGTLAERLVYATERNDWSYPYRAHLPDWNGRNWEGQLVCGENPYLYARIVEHLVVGAGEALHWSEVGLGVSGDVLSY
jgi:hypothetical protein